MNQSDLPAFTEALRGLSIGLRHRADYSSPEWKDTLRVYWHDLADLPLGAVQQACAELRRAGQSFPRVAELRTVAQRYQVSDSKGGCSDCAERPGFVPARWWSPIYNAYVSGWAYCRCDLGQRKIAYVERQQGFSKHLDRRVEPRDDWPASPMPAAQPNSALAEKLRRLLTTTPKDMP